MGSDIAQLLVQAVDKKELQSSLDNDDHKKDNYVQTGTESEGIVE